MKRWLAAGLMLAALVLPAVAAAQGPTRLASLQVSMWPEYDQRSVLVILQAQLPPDVPVPTTIQLPIPAAAGQPHAVAFADGAGGLVDANFVRTVQGDWAIINIESQSRSIWLEYYAQLAIDGAQRSFTYVWPAEVAVGALGYDVQQPPGASALTVTPAPQTETTNNRGLTVVSSALGAWPEGQPVSVTVSYVRPIDELTVDLLAAGTEPTAANPGSVAPAIVALASGLALAAAGALWYRRRRPSRVRSVRRRPSPSRARYCHACGTQTQAGDKFCRSCGTELRQ
ncbi:MAG TPA: zinc ribbon domain-containing protein [Anaerolineales bacterium]|jgi:hypothetical protein